MKYFPLKTLLIGSVILLYISGCSDSTQKETKNQQKYETQNDSLTKITEAILQKKAMRESKGWIKPLEPDTLLKYLPKTFLNYKVGKPHSVKSNINGNAISYASVEFSQGSSIYTITLTDQLNHLQGILGHGKMLMSRQESDTLGIVEKRLPIKPGMNFGWMRFDNESKTFSATIAFEYRFLLTIEGVAVPDTIDGMKIYNTIDISHFSGL
jgi:hypothetical protein